MLDFFNLNNINCLCLVLEPGAAAWKAQQTNPVSYGGIYAWFATNFNLIYFCLTQDAVTLINYFCTWPFLQNRSSWYPQKMGQLLQQINVKNVHLVYDLSNMIRHT